MPSPFIAVFERTPYWAPELQRQFAGRALTVRPCRSVADLQAFIAASHPQIVLLDFEAAPEDCLAWLRRRGLSPSAPAILVAGSSRSSDLEWTLRELGSVEFLSEALSGDELARRCRHLLRERGLTLPEEASHTPFPVAPTEKPLRRRGESPTAESLLTEGSPELG